MAAWAATQTAGQLGHRIYKETEKNKKERSDFMQKTKEYLLAEMKVLHLDNIDVIIESSLGDSDDDEYGWTTE